MKERLRAQGRQSAETQAGPLSPRLHEALALSMRDRSLPSERDMAKVLGVSRSTLQNCLKDLAQTALVQTRHGSGTVVLGHLPKALSRHSGFAGDARARGLIPSSDIPSLTTGPAGAPVLRIAQVGYGADGKAVEDSLTRYRGNRSQHVGEPEG